MTTITDQRPDVDADTREIMLLNDIRAAYPSLYVTTWIALIQQKLARIPAHYCAIALPDGYAVHAVLVSGRLGALVRRYRLSEVAR